MPHYYASTDPRLMPEPDFKLVELPTSFHYVRRTITLPENDKHRLKLNHPARMAFRAAALEVFVSRLPEVAQVEAYKLVSRHWYEIHHIIPRVFGGTNDYDNLALIQRVDHERAHEIIHDQAVGMQPGESREISVPWDPIGPGTVWWCSLGMAPRSRGGWKPFAVEADGIAGGRPLAADKRFKLTEFPAQIQTIRKTVTLAKNEGSREPLYAAPRNEFRAKAIETYVTQLPMPLRVEAQKLLMRHWYEIHHIVPRMLGGTNDISNLALVQRMDHDRAHEMIDRQTKGMQPGETREINLPWDPIGPGNVWWALLAAMPEPRKGWRPLKLASAAARPVPFVA